MNFEPDEKDWMAYLYGELDEHEKQRFDDYLSRSPEAQQELARLQRLRGLMASLEDHEVIPPPIFAPASDSPRQRVLQLLSSPGVRLVASIAASIVVVILVGRLANMQVVFAENAVTLSFGEQPVPTKTTEPVPVLTASDVQRMIDASVHQNNERVEASLRETQASLEESIRKNLNANAARLESFVRQASTASQDEISRFAATMREQNRDQMQEYFALSSAEQKQYLENLLVDFAKYLQQQRNNDLAVMQLRMKNLEEHNVVLRQETEQILASIITTVGAPVSEERRN